jgi:hypothetical protein
LPATSRASHAASTVAWASAVAPFVAAEAAAASAIGPVPTMPSCRPSSEPRFAGGLARVGPAQRGQVVRRDPDAGTGQPPAVLHQRRHLLDEGGDGGLPRVRLGVEAGRAAAHLQAEAGGRVGGGAGEELGAVAQHLRCHAHHAHRRRVTEVEGDEPVGAGELVELH